MQGDDLGALLATIKADIAAVESRGADAELLGEIESCFLQMLELIKLFLISERDSYYGYFLMNMRFQTDFTSRCIAGIRLNTFPPLFTSNPLLLCGYSLKEIVYVVCHEVDHVLLNHPAEMVRLNPEGDPQRYTDFNYAADASVNDRLDAEVASGARRFMSRPEGAVTSRVFARAYGLEAVEAGESYLYYLGLIDEATRRPEQQGDEGSGEGPGDGNEQEDGPQDGDGSGDPAGQLDLGGVVTRLTCGRPVDHDWQAGDDPEEVQSLVRELVNAAVNCMGEEARGLMPASFASQVHLLNEPPRISWQQVLKKYVGTVVAGKRKTRSRLNRRQPMRYDLSGCMDDKTLKIAAAIDTSGSVGDREISRIFSEIFAILSKKRYELTVIECDAEVQRVYRARSPRDIRPKVMGRGGTEFTPVIEYVNADRYFRDALLIYFTDGYGESKIPKPLTYRNLWVVFGDAENLSLDEPYGAVLAL